MLRAALRAAVTASLPSPKPCRRSGSHHQVAVCSHKSVVPSRLQVPSIRRCSSSARMSEDKDISSPKQQDTSPVQEESKATKTVNARIKGTVQGVFYRKWTVDTAQRLGLKGWVRNCRDGCVEAVFSGQPELVDSMLHKCRVGPPAAKVTAVDVSAWSDPVPDGFEQRPTTW